MSDADFEQSAIQASAAWWASRLGNCHHDPVGLNSPNARLTVDDMEWAVLLNVSTVRGKYSAGEQDAYRQALEGVITDHLRDCAGPDCHGKRRGDGRHVFECDYDPDAVLCAAAERAGISLGSRDLPMKTFMIFEADSVVVSEGYGAPFEVVWRRQVPADTSAGLAFTRETET